MGLRRTVRRRAPDRSVRDRAVRAGAGRVPAPVALRRLEPPGRTRTVGLLASPRRVVRQVAKPRAAPRAAQARARRCRPAGRVRRAATATGNPAIVAVARPIPTAKTKRRRAATRAWCSVAAGTRRALPTSSPTTTLTALRHPAGCATPRATATAPATAAAALSTSIARVRRPTPANFARSTAARSSSTARRSTRTTTASAPRRRRVGRVRLGSIATGHSATAVAVFSIPTAAPGTSGPATLATIPVPARTSRAPEPSTRARMRFASSRRLRPSGRATRPCMRTRSNATAAAARMTQIVPTTHPTAVEPAGTAARRVRLRFKQRTRRSASRRRPAGLVRPRRTPTSTAIAAVAFWTRTASGTCIANTATAVRADGAAGSTRTTSRSASSAPCPTGGRARRRRTGTAIATAAAGQPTTTARACCSSLVTGVTILAAARPRIVRRSRTRSTPTTTRAARTERPASVLYTPPGA